MSQMTEVLILRIHLVFIIEKLNVKLLWPSCFWRNTAGKRKIKPHIESTGIWIIQIQRDLAARQLFKWWVHCLISVMTHMLIFYTVVLRFYPAPQLPSQIMRGKNIAHYWLITSKGFEDSLTLTFRSLGRDPQHIFALRLLKNTILWGKGMGSTISVSAENLVLWFRLVALKRCSQ